MANEYAVNRDDLEAVADAIRAKNDTEDALVFPEGFVAAIGEITGENHTPPVLDASLPADVTILAGTDASAAFAVAFTKAGYPEEYAYQWYKDGEAIDGATQDSYTITDTAQTGTNQIHCVVSHCAGSVISRVATFKAIKLPVLSTAYPADVTVVAAQDASATFAVAIADPGYPDSYAYQWYKDGEAIDGETAPSCTLTGLIATGAHEIHCVVSHEAGDVTSRTAALQVVSLPVLDAAYPADVSVSSGEETGATFAVQIETDGYPNAYTYAWYLDGAAVSGATGASYTPAAAVDVGAHTVYCAVSNAAGTVNSRTATFEVKSSLPVYTYTGNSELAKDGDGWKLKLLTSGTLTFSSFGTGAGRVQAFLVGGGGSGGGNLGGGGAGGKTKTGSATLQAGTPYTITIGAGGTGSSSSTGTGNAGGTTSALGLSAAGGNGGYGGTHTGAVRYGGSGGSGGGAGSYGANSVGGAGGSYGGAGASNSNGTAGGGSGQGTTTREFGESGGAAYAGGGGGAGATPWYATAYGGAGGAGGGGRGTYHQSGGSAGSTNFGGGGGGGDTPTTSGLAGGCGIVIIRNAR